MQNHHIVRTRTRRLLALLVTSMAAAPATASACEPSTVTLAHPPGYESGGVFAFGPSGLIGGAAERFDPVTGSFEQVAVLWHGERPSVVGDVPGGFVADINSRGDVLVAGEGQALLVSQGVARHIPGLGGDLLQVRRLDDSGDVAGSANRTTGGPQLPVLWKGGRDPVELPLPEGADGGFLQGINDRGDAVGTVYGPDMEDAYMWRSDGTHGRLDPGDWGPDDPGFGAANVVDGSGRAGGSSGPFFAPGSRATVWSRSGTHAASIGDIRAILFGTNGQGDFVGGGLDDHEWTWRTLLMRHDGEALALLPASGDPDDVGLAHAVSKVARGDVTVGGASTPPGGGEPRATLWRCAYAQAVPYDTAPDGRPARAGSGRAWRIVPGMSRTARATW